MKNLSLREQDIYDLIVWENLSIDDIAKRLFIEACTVKTHLHKIFLKTQYASRADIIFNFYKEHNMILKLTNQLEKLIAKKDVLKDKIQEVAKKLLALIEKTEAQIAKAKEVLAKIADN